MVWWPVSMRTFVFALVLTIGASLAAPLPVFAALPGAFGGRVTLPGLPCAPGQIFFMTGFINGITPYVGPVLWIPSTKPNAVNFSAYPVPGQCILGTIVPGACSLLLVTIPIPVIRPIPGYGTSVPGCLL